jgi:hypothetical protein
MNTDSQAVHDHQIFSSAIAKAKEERERRKRRLTRPAALGGYRTIKTALDALDAEIARVNLQVARTESAVQVLKQVHTGQTIEAGNAKLRGIEQGTVMTLSVIANKTASDLKSALAALAGLASERAALQVRRRELLSGRAI